MTASAPATTQHVASGFIFKIAERRNLNRNYCYNYARRVRRRQGSTR
jgi:hypothetical protein